MGELRSERRLGGGFLAATRAPNSKPKPTTPNASANTPLSVTSPAQLAIEHRVGGIGGVDVRRDGGTGLQCRSQLCVDALLKVADVVGARVDSDPGARVLLSGVLVTIGRRYLVRCAVVAIVLFESSTHDFGGDGRPTFDFLPGKHGPRGPREGAHADGGERQREQHEAPGAEAIAVGLDRSHAWRY